MTTDPAQTLHGARGKQRAADLAEDLGGDPPCWLNQVCPECGRMIEDRYADACPNCGAERAP